jgi:hypothetical protein
VHPEIASRVPDIGAFFLDWLGSPGSDQVMPYVDALRSPDGRIPRRAVRAIDRDGRRSGPLLFLSQMATYDEIALTVWASYGESRARRRAIEEITRRVLADQGHAAAASWVITARPGDRLDVDFLAGQLVDSWSKGVEFARNGDVIKAFRKWAR